MNEIIEELTKELELKKMQIDLETANYKHRMALLALDMNRVSREILDMQEAMKEEKPYYMN